MSALPATAGSRACYTVERIATTQGERYNPHNLFHAALHAGSIESREEFKLERYIQKSVNTVIDINPLLEKVQQVDGFDGILNKFVDTKQAKH